MWTQSYDPYGALWISTLLASIPVILLLGLLAFAHVRAHTAAIWGLVSALAVAVFAFGMPWELAWRSAVFGAAYGLFPIGWIVFSAIFVYDVTVEAGQFEVIKQSISGLARDSRIQVLLIAFSFGAFIEGAAGFGTPVAISAAMLIGLGFEPLKAAGLALIGNTAPVAFGALGTPLITLASVTGLPLEQLSATVGQQLPWFALLIPFWLIWAMAGFRNMLQVWPACLTAGASFGIMQFLVSNYHGPWLVDVVSALFSIAALIILLRFWQPKTNHEFVTSNEVEPPKTTDSNVESGDNKRPSYLRAWAPWIVLTLFVFIWGLPQMKKALDSVSSPKFEVPGLHLQVQKGPPVAKETKAEEAVFKLNWMSATGSALLLTGFVASAIVGLSPRRTLRVLLGTCKRTAWSLVTIAAMLALGYTTRFAGLDSTLGLAMASTGILFPFFSPLMGWLGVALTGSDTSSNVLFGNLQQVTAERLGMSPILAAASNSSGGVMGKMIDAQSIVVASIATNQHGQEGKILRYVFWHSLVLAGLVGCMVFIQNMMMKS